MQLVSRMGDASVNAMTCPTCQRDPGPGPLCAGCGAIQPLPPALDAFSVLGLPATFALQAARVDERVKELSRRLHPDRFAQKSPRERRLSLEWTTAVNDAARAVRDPLRRASTLLKAQGIDVEKESGAGAMGRLPPEFLGEVLEIREELAQARAAGDLARVRELGRKVKERAAGVTSDLAGAFAEHERSPDPTLLDRAATAVAVLRYHARFEEEVEAAELQALDQG